MSRIFVSHSSRDHESAKSLGEWLEKEGHTSYFLDFDPEKGIPPGKSWEDELYRRLRLCRAVIALVSPNWLESRWCFAEVTQARATGKPVFLAKVAPCSTEKLFADVQHVDLRGDDEGFRRLARGLKEVGIEPGETFEWDPSRPPYPGLLTFEEEDAAVFFGRDGDIQKGMEVLDGLRHRGASSFLLCLGASGSGKSSLMRAGLIPRLRKTPGAWLPVGPFRPQEDPLEELAIALSRAFEELGEPREWKRIYEQLYSPHTSRDWAGAPEKHPVTGEGLKEIARDLRVLARQQDATILLAVDQTEELFGYTDAQNSRAFLQCLRGALEASGRRLMAIATIRSDTFGNFQTHPDLQDFSYEMLNVAPIPLRDLPQVIEGPAHAADISLEPGLVQMLVEDATTTDALPLLAFTLRELFERYGRDNRLEINEYERLGRLEGSVRRRADDVIRVNSPGPEELAALRQAFVPAMVRVSEDGNFMRRRARWLDLPARAHGLLQQFIEARLLVSHGEGGERVVEVAHEALLRSWPRLQDWLREDRDNLRLLDDLRRAADAWQAAGREEGWLAHHGERLEAVEEMLRSPRFGQQAGQVAGVYLAECVRKRQAQLEAEARAARRMRMATIVIAVIAVIAIGAAVYGWYEKGIADKQRNLALSTVSRQKADEGHATLGMLLALEAIPKGERKDRSFVPEAEASLLYAMLAQREKHVLRHAEAVYKARFSGKGALVVTASRDGTARVWNAETGKMIAPLEGHSGKVYQAVFSPDGKRVVTASSDKTARLWNAKTGEMIAILEGHKEDVLQAAFSPQGDRIVTASQDDTARLWNAKTGEMIAILEGHKEDVLQAAFSPQGDRIVTASQDGTARLWNAKTGEMIVPLEGHDGWVIQASFSPQGDRIVTASWDGTGRLWNAHTGKLIGKLEGHTGGVNGAAFSPEGELVVTISEDGTARLWDGSTGDEVAVLEGHKGLVHEVRFSRDGSLLVTGADDGTARLWDVASRRTMSIFRGHTGRVWSVSFSPDGRFIATSSEDKTARIWEIAPRLASVLRGHEDRVHKAVFDPEGGLLVTVSDDRTARLWNGKTGVAIGGPKEHNAKVWYAAFSPNGKHFVTTSNDGTARLWDTASGSLLYKLEGHKGLVNHAHFSPKGRRLVTAGDEGTARVWDVESGEPLHILEGHEGSVYFAEFSHDGRLIATGSEDGTARLWDAATGKGVANLVGHQRAVINAAFSPGDKRLVTASRDPEALLWDVERALLQNVESEEPLAVLAGHEDDVLCAAFSTCGRFIVTASSDNHARIWNAADGRPLLVLQGHEGEVYDASFSPDGRLILTASGDGTVRLWHAESGLPVAVLKGHDGPVVSAAFSPDGRHVATASWDRTARLWKLPVWTGDDWIDHARKNLPRQFTADERRQYLAE